MLNIVASSFYSTRAADSRLGCRYGCQAHWPCHGLLGKLRNCKGQGHSSLAVGSQINADYKSKIHFVSPE